MRKFFFYSLLAAGLFTFVTSCQKDIHNFKSEVKLNLPDESLDYVNGEWLSSNSILAQDVPSVLRLNGVTNDGATLGRVLFYDTQLSLNNRVSCASCHDQQKAFADVGVSSVGFENKVTPRNSMAIVNPVFNNSLFWDSRVNTLEELVAEPIQNHVEMGMESMEQLSTKLRNVDYYGPLFEKAFGTNMINEERIVNAMSQFLKSMVSVESKFDKGLASNFSNFTAQEARGQQIFFSKDANCSSCHSGVNFSAPDGFGAGSAVGANTEFFNVFAGNQDMNEYAGTEIKGTANIGLDLVYSDDGFGDGQFKIPTLRNIELTGPYMHDGRYATLEEVVDHYDSKIKLHDNLDDKFIQAGQVKRLNLSDDDKSALVAFLKTLTDEEFSRSERFSDPFVQ